MSLQSYYDNFATQPSRWADPDEKECACHGSGWFASELDTWHKCPYHFKSYLPHPEDDVDWDEHAVICMVGFFGRCKKVAPQVSSGSCWPVDPDDDIPF